MFVPFLIMLREGLEAALIVSLIASYLKRTQRGRWIGVMWIGVLLAAALCLGLGIFINETTGEFPQNEQELFRGGDRRGDPYLDGFLDAQRVAQRQSATGTGSR